MRLAIVHADRVAVEASVPAAADPPEDPGGARELVAENALLVACAVDAIDVADGRTPGAGAAAVNGVADDLGPDRVVVLTPPAVVDADEEAVVALLSALADRVEVETIRAAVGYHLAVDCAAKGHPFALQVHAPSPGSERDDPTRPPATGALRAGPSEADRERFATLDFARPTDGGRVWTPAGTAVRRAVRRLALSVADRVDAVRVESSATYPVDASTTTAVAGTVAATPYRLAGGRCLRFWPHLGHLPVLADGGRGFAVVEDALVAHDGPGGAERSVPAVTALRPPKAIDAAVGECLDASREALSSLGVEVAVRRGTPAPDGSEVDGPWTRSVALVAAGATDRLATGSIVVAESAAAVHSSLPADEALVCWRPLGSVEAALAATLAAGAESDPPALPPWLRPVQLRVVPVDDRHEATARDVAARLASSGVRVDVDDRAATVGERLATAERQWIPRVAVIGDRERRGDDPSLTVTDRLARTERRRSVADVVSSIDAASDRGGGAASDIDIETGANVFLLG